MIGALIRTFLKGVVVLVLLAAGLVAYYLYRSGSFPFLKEAVEDATVVGSVKAALAIHRDLAARAIRVEADRGRVVLSGEVATEVERKEAGELAQSVDGVREVANRIDVDPGVASRSSDDRSLGERLDDVALLAKVRASLRLDRTTRPLDLDVSVRAGIVLVRGTVPTEEMRKRVIERVGSVGGVGKLDDELSVEGKSKSKSNSSSDSAPPSGAAPTASSAGRESERFQ
jgi:hyperosmotically inducible periplasmic protein